MQFFSIPVLAILATGALGMPTEPEAHTLEARADCSTILPACNGGSVVGQTNCRCPGQAETCDLWSCPGGPPNTVRIFPDPSLFFREVFSMGTSDLFSSLYSFYPP